MPSKPSKKTITDIIAFCNSQVVPDENYIAAPVGYPSEWFENYFYFISDPVLKKYLGEAFYQSRFLYKIMLALNLPQYKNIGVVKFQIIQYASICEALIQFVIETKFKDEYSEQNIIYEYTLDQNAISKSTSISFGGTPLYLCKKKKIKPDLKRDRIDKKIAFCLDKGIISDASAKDFQELYDARNNIHILKAVDTNYKPRVHKAKAAFILMSKIRNEIKDFIEDNP